MKWMKEIAALGYLLNYVSWTEAAYELSKEAHKLSQFSSISNIKALGATTRLKFQARPSFFSGLPLCFSIPMKTLVK